MKINDTIITNLTATAKELRERKDILPSERNAAIKLDTAVRLLQEANEQTRPEVPAEEKAEG